MNIKEQIEKRKEFNLEILNYIKEQVIKYPEIRFIQLLMNLGVISNEDKFYEESYETLRKLQNGEKS